MRQRAVAAGALALASGTLLAALGPASPAGAATAVSAPAFYSGATEGDVLQVALNLPTALPTLGQNLALGLISAKGQALHDGINHRPDLSTSFAGLSSGSLVEGANAPLAALHRTVEATLAKQHLSDTLAAIPSNPLITGAVGSLTADVSSVSTLDNSSTANLASANIGRLGDILPAQVLQPLNDAYSQVANQATSAINTVISNLQPVLAPVVQNDPTGAAAGIQPALQNLVAEIPNLLTTLENNALVKLSVLNANQAIGLVSGGEQSSAHAKLVSLDVLGGLVHVDGFTSDASAFADGIAGHGRASVTPVVAHATIGKSVLGVSLDQNGLGLTVGGIPSQIVAQVNQALAQVQDALNQVLSTLGVSIKPASGTTQVSRDGTSAKATGGSLTITVAPPLASLAGNKATAAATPLLEVKLGGTTAEATAKQQAVAVAPLALPHTGANLPLLAGSGAAFLIAAGYIRRRFVS